MGIYRVQLANLDTTTNGSIDGYRDYSCLSRANLMQGSTYTLRVQTGAPAAENAVAWIDYNNDGSFTASERILYSLNAQAHTASFTVPVTATLNQPLRLRIAADYVNSPIPTACSTPQYSQTEDYQVRISPGNAAPVARFTTADTLTCSGTVAFRDESINTPTAWRWQFGDGSTSTLQHPTHTYTAAGTYAVRLRVCNPGGCDSLSRVSYVTVRTDGPRGSTCSPTTSAYCCQYGVTRVRLATLDHASADGQAGYEDFSCAFRTTLTADQPYTLQLTTGSNAHDVRVYLDLNDDGQFTSPSELLYQGLAVLNPSIPLTIASSLGPVYNRALRLRIVADAAGSVFTNSCGVVQSGQAEDYTVTLLPNAVRPMAAFVVRYQRLCGPVQVGFTNATTGGATAYTWDFGDGSSSSQATPGAHTYATPGVYEVRLVAQNAFGRDTARQRVAVATACPSYCPAVPDGGSSLRPAYFTRFQFANLDNTAFRGPGVGYRDFTAQVATVQAGQTYTLRAESLPYSFGGAGPWNALEVWIDFDQDGIFSQAEHVGPFTQFSPHQLSIRIPPGAKAGATRLRAILYLASSTQYIYPGGCTGANLTGAAEEYTVMIIPPPIAPRTGFYADMPTACNSLVQFRDTSWSAPSSWRWTFGDGTSSTAQHPLHAYTAPGTYTVSLQAGNAYGAQSLTRPAYVTVNALANGPRPAVCLPSPVVTTTTGQHGIDTLRIGTAFFYHQPWNSPGYRDETCTITPISLVRGASYPLRFADSNSDGTACFVWLDANGNGEFESPAELVFNDLVTVPQPGGFTVGTLSVPATALTARPLRMRVVQWGYRSGWPLLSPPSPCSQSGISGQVRDFTVVLANPLTTLSGDPVAGAWQLAPNPTSGLVTVHGKFTSPVGVEIWDAVGRIVYRTAAVPNVQANLPLDLRGLPRGVYLVRLSNSRQLARLSLE